MQFVSTELLDWGHIQGAAMLDLIRQRLRQSLVECITALSNTDKNREIVFVGLYADLYHGLFDVCLDDLDNMAVVVSRDRSEVMQKRAEMLRESIGQVPARYYLAQYRNTIRPHTKYFADFKYPFLRCHQFHEWEDYTRREHPPTSQAEFEEQALHFCWLVLDDLFCSGCLNLLDRGPLLRLGFQTHDDDLGVIVTHEIPAE